MEYGFMVIMVKRSISPDCICIQTNIEFWISVPFDNSFLYIGSRKQSWDYYYYKRGVLVRIVSTSGSRAGSGQESGNGSAEIRGGENFWLDREPGPGTGIWYRIRIRTEYTISGQERIDILDKTYVVSYKCCGAGTGRNRNRIRSRCKTRKGK